VRVGEPGFVEGRLVWVVTPPSTSGNAIVVSAVPGEPVRRESPAGSSVRSRLYGYGAAAWCATPSGLVGIESRTQQLCRVTPERLVPIGAGPAADSDRLGDPACVPGSSWVVCVRERRGATASRVTLVAIDAESEECVELHEADGLAAEPTVDPATGRIAWIQWPAMTMPWDDGLLLVARLELDGTRPSLRAPHRLDGGRGCAAGQPVWLADGSLAYVTEGAGYSQPWHCDRDGVVRRLTGSCAEFQRPRWTTCRWLAGGSTDLTLVCAFADADGEHVGTLDPDGALEELDQPCVRVDGVAADAASIAWVGATTRAQGAVFCATRKSPSIHAAMPSSHLAVSRNERRVAADKAPEPETFGFDHEGVELTGVRWAPTGQTASGTPPPLVVAVHPGPTGATDRSHSPLVHLLCAHGFAVASVDYSGSTAHGRRHRERLLARYGELDVAECTAAATHLVNDGFADGRCTFIRGTSAGGTTALLALCSGVFEGAVAWYPASRFDDVGGELGFEAGYLSALLGDDAASRSPLSRAAQMKGSVLIVQGADDDVVDPADTAHLADRLGQHLDDVTSVVVPGEGHGFRTATGRALALGYELDFYRRLAVTRIGIDARCDSSASDAILRRGAL